MSVPAVSVVLTTKNRAGRLEALIGSLREQELDPSQFEVVVVDNASGDGTAELLQREQEAGPLQLRSVHCDIDRGTAASRNLGWRAARGSLIAFTDDDCELAPDWLTTLLDAARRHPGAILQGRTEPIERERALLSPLARTKEVTELGPYYETCNIAYPRELLERLGGFDADAFPGWGGEDTDLAWRALDSGIEAVFVDGARAYHAVNVLGAHGTLRLALGWSDSMRVLARHPSMRRHLHRWIFLKRSHQDLLLAAAGLILRRRSALALLLVLPYLRLLRMRTVGRPWLAPMMILYDALEMFAAVRGGIKARTPVL
jgi:glycosyltransferase involved in cell wall biosynthesis